jgi:hypothetical protein
VVDILLLNIGGNNAGFGDVGEACVLNLLDNCGADEALRQNVTDRINGLPAKYSALNDELKKFNVQCIMIGEYPDPTRGNKGNFCNTVFGNDNAGSCWGPLELGISSGDFAWVYDNLVTKLNEKINTAAQTYGWTYIGGMMAKTKNFGLCRCSGGYFNTFGQSFSTQGDLCGSLHPNATGYKEIYRDIVSAKIRACIASIEATSKKITTAITFTSPLKSPLKPISSTVSTSLLTTVPKIDMSKITVVATTTTSSEEDLREFQILKIIRD